MATLAMFAILLLLRFTPDAPAARLLHRWLVALPAARLARVTRGQVLLALVLAALVAAAGWIIGDESWRLLGMAAPDVATWLTMIEASTWLDVVAAAVLGSASLRWTGVAARLRAAVGVRRSGGGRRTPREPRTRGAKPVAGNDDGEDGNRRVVA